jgi:hypothetical protein
MDQRLQFLLCLVGIFILARYARSAAAKAGIPSILSTLALGAVTR